MFLENITDGEIAIFMKEYVKELHINLQNVYDDCTVNVYDIERCGNSITMLTQIGDKSGLLTEHWGFTPYKAFYRNDYQSYESLPLLKEWSKFVYEILKTKDENLANQYRKSFMEYIKAERDGKIAMAKNEYEELSL